MAALLNTRPAFGAWSAAETIERLNCAVQASLLRHGRLAGHWDIEFPPDLPVPPD